MQLYYLVPGFGISMFKSISINRSMLLWSGEQALEKLHLLLPCTVLWLLRRGGVTTHDFFRRTAKNLVAYAASWLLTLSPGSFIDIKKALYPKAFFLNLAEAECRFLVSI